jgi:hypothetical protein
MKSTRWTGVVTVFLICLMMVACSPTTTAPAGSTQTQTAAAKKEPVLYTGKSCLSQMAGMAGRWQQDAVPFHMESGLNAESNGHDGKSTIWRGMFASPSRRTYKVFTCSGSRLRDEAATGVTSTAETAYGPTVPALMFQSFFLTTDSDKAYALAQENGGAKLLAQDPQQPVLYTLDWNAKQKQLLWVVIYGTAPNQSKGIGVIDASTGKFLRAAK